MFPYPSLIYKFFSELDYICRKREHYSSKMKKIYLIILLIASLSQALPAADKDGKVKTGWNFGFVPAVSYNSDLGFQYGLNADIFNYGDGSDFPRYRHKFSTEISRYTKGMTRLHLFYDSKFLIPGIRVTAAATYMNNPMFSFYGFNGAVEPYVPEWNANKETGVAFYNFKRDMLRVLADFQGEIVPGLNWAAGLSFWRFDIADISKETYTSGCTLYDAYKAYGLIHADEAEGGNRLEMKAGLVYDTRDLDAAPSRGIWAELYLNGSPDVFGDGYKYLKLCAHFRQYLPVMSDNRMTFAYHLAYQGTVGGRVPFYMQSNITTLYLRQINSEGLGSINTVRGTLYNRMIGDSYAWANFEMRIKLLSFDFINQSWYLAANPFFDLGAIVKPYRLDEYPSTSFILGESVPVPKSFTGPVNEKDATKLHESVGAGLKLVMNQNFIVGCEVAKALDPDDNPGLGINIGLNYIF